MSKPSRIPRSVRLALWDLRLFSKRHGKALKVLSVILVILIAAGTYYKFFVYTEPINYSLRGKVRQLVGDPMEQYDSALKKGKNDSFSYNKDFTPRNSGVKGPTGQPKFSAEFGNGEDYSAKIIDAVNKVSLTFKPKFKMNKPRKDHNRIVYGVPGMDALKVYTLKATTAKEDLVLGSFQGDELNFDYELGLSEGLEPKIENDGSLGVYGVDSMLLGDVATGSEKDAALLKEAREKGEKPQLLFHLPAPFIVEAGKQASSAKAWFSLEGNILTVHATGLKDATYPLSIDPSVYVETAGKLMRGNNETNVDFDVANELIQKGSTTGARFDSLTSSMAMPSARWNHGTAVAGGYIYSVGGSNGSTPQANVYWAKLNSNNASLESSNPGDVVCSGWCTKSEYSLPAAREGLSLVAYNGFLYVFGGEDGSGNRTNTVYIAKLGANGEPSKWHPTDENPNNWVYWYADTMTSERSYLGAVAYNNRMYLIGGQTNASPGGTTTIEYANINPTGTLSAWSNSGMATLPSARFGHDVQTYNDRLYVIGGNSEGTLQETVHYIKLSSNGTMAGSWIETAEFTTARMNWGGNMTTVWGGYIYLSGGCIAVNVSGNCTSIENDVQLASINADGSIGKWGSISNITNQRIGFGFVAWRNALYMIGGCSSQNTTTGSCNTTLSTSSYGRVNQDGDASTVSNSVAPGIAPCDGDNPYNCDIPPAGDNSGEAVGGRMSSGVAVNNGFIYIIGGCATISGASSCGSGEEMSGNISYAAISSEGTIVSPSTCTGLQYGTWCVDSTNQLNGTAGMGTMGTAVFNNVIYVVGGTDGSSWSSRIYRVSLLPNGALSGGWDSQTFGSIGMGSARGYSFAFTRANPGSASTNPGNLYVIGGCSGTGGIGCSTYYSDVYKCNIAVDATINGCSTSGQLQIDAEPGIGGTQGLGLMAGFEYANFLYLVGGSTPNSAERGEVMYAKIDASNNIVAVSGSTWITSPNTLDPIRRRGFAFGYNGYLYSLAGYNPTDSLLNDLVYAKINVSDGSIGAFKTSLVTVSPRWDLRAIVSNGYVYAIGGCESGSAPGGCTSTEGSIQTFQLYNNDSGAPSGYDTSGNLFSTDRLGASTTIYNGYIYIAGGCIVSDDCTDATNSVQYAALNSDGSIGTWSATTAALPADRVYGQLEQAGGTLYYIGGQDDSGTAQSTVYYATPSSGNITTWNTASNGLPQARSQHGATVWNNRIYVTGGQSGTTVYSSVYVSPQLNSGGDITSTWNASTSFNVARSGHTAIAYANNLYTLGGFDGSNYLNDVQYTQINSDGTIDGWTDTTSLPQRVRNADGFAANGYMYLFGGRSDDFTCTNNTYVSSISANTTIASGNNPTGIGAWFLTNVRYSTERYGVAAAYDQGKAYVLGGACMTLASGGTNIVLEDDFDPGIDGGDWSSTSGMIVGGNCGTLDAGNALVSSGQGDDSAVTADLDVSYGGTIAFVLRIPTFGSSPCQAPENGEDLQLQYSNNGGSGWSTIATYDESNFNSPSLVTANIPFAAQTSSTRFRWIIPNADSAGNDEWAIDSVVITANTAPASTEILEDDFDPGIDGTDWSDTGGTNIGFNCGVISSGQAMVSTGGGSASGETRDLDVTYGGTVTFDLYIPGPGDLNGACTAPESGEDLQLQYSINNSGNWTTIATYDESGYSSPTTVSVIIPDGAKTDDTRFRWIMPLADIGGDEWAIDNVSIKAVDPPVLTYTGIHRVVYSTLQSQPQVAKYSRRIDTDTDVFPTKWLLNGVDNSIGARWMMRYRSSTDAANSWGADTNFGAVTLGQPENYVAVDGAGLPTNFARYYYMSITIDSSQAYGYPDDVTRGPTINDLSLFFTSDPSKRLRHGKTFTGGEQQPLDTPFP